MICVYSLDIYMDHQTHSSYLGLIAVLVALVAGFYMGQQTSLIAQADSASAETMHQHIHDEVTAAVANLHTHVHTEQAAMMHGENPQTVTQ